MKKIYFVMVMMLAIVGLKAQVLQNQEFAKANFYYNESKYDTALVIYEGILKDGFVSAPLLYNIGNTYFKMRNYPMAILNYEKALKLDPTDDDIRQNLIIANALITDKIEPLPVFFVTRWWRNLGNALTVNGWATVTLILLGIFLLLLFLYLTAHTSGGKKATFFLGIITILLLICSGIIALQKYQYLNERNEAIIMRPTITVKSSPSSTGVDLFVLHEGTKVTVLDKDGDWDKIKIADGSTGWLPSSSSIKY